MEYPSHSNWNSNSQQCYVGLTLFYEISLTFKFKFITMLRGTDNILRNVPHIQIQIHIRMLCGTDNILWNIPHIQIQIQIHNNLMWDWHYSMEYPPHSNSNSNSQQCYVGLTLFYRIFLTSVWMWGIFCIILSVPQNIVMDVNDVVKNWSLSYTRTGWVWEIIGWSWRPQPKSLNVSKESMDYTSK